jgi:preprotein translocase subunit SecE
MARKPGNSPQAMKARAQKTAAAIAPASALAAAPERPKKRTNPVQFAQEVRAEARKITWTSRRETWITSVMVFIMVLISAAFFWLVDFIINMGVQNFLKLVVPGS